MFEEVRIRERKSAKHGKTYEYRFETAPVGGERKWLSKGGFLSEEEAKNAGRPITTRSWQLLPTRQPTPQNPAWILLSPSKPI